MPQQSFKKALTKRIKAIKDEFLAALAEELEEPAKKLTNRHRGVVMTWANKPIFSYRITVNGEQCRLTVFPKGAGRQQYQWVDKGTKPYDIKPKNGGFLKFKVGYDARTQPVARFGVGTGQKFGGWVSTKKTIHHPGIRARKFSERFGKSALPAMRQAQRNAYERATLTRV